MSFDGVLARPCSLIGTLVFALGYAAFCSARGIGRWQPLASGRPVASCHATHVYVHVDKRFDSE